MSAHTAPQYCHDSYFGDTYFNTRSALCPNPTLTLKDVQKKCSSKAAAYGIQGILPGPQSVGCLVKGKPSKEGKYGLSCAGNIPTHPDLPVWCP